MIKTHYCKEMDRVPFNCVSNEGVQIWKDWAGWIIENKKNKAVVYNIIYCPFCGKDLEV